MSAVIATGTTLLVAAACASIRLGVSIARRRRANDRLGPSRAESPSASSVTIARAVAAVADRLQELHRRRRSEERADLQIVDLAEGLAAALRRGATLPEALTELDLARSELDPTSTDPHRRILSLGVIVGGQVGGSVADVFDSVAASVRDRCDQRRSARIATASARASGWVITALPVVVVSVLSLDGRFRHSSFATVPGLSALASAALLELLGWSWMRRLMRTVA